MVTETPDPELVAALAKKNVKMHTKEEEDPREGSKVFHPAAAKALKIKQAVMLDPIEPPKVDETKIDAMGDLTTEVLGEMQSGALSMAGKKPWEPKYSDSPTCPISETVSNAVILTVRVPTLPMHKRRWRRPVVKTWLARQREPRTPRSCS